MKDKRVKEAYPRLRSSAYFIVAAAASLAWNVFSADIVRLHEARGLWWEFMRLEEAGALAGGVRCDYSWDVYGSPDGYHGCGAPLAGFPASLEALAKYDVVVIHNCRCGAMPQTAQQNLRAWVSAGGSLLVTGGPFAFGAGACKGEPIEELLPAAVSEKSDFVKAAGDTALTPTTAGSAALGAETPWRQKPRVFYIHAGLSPRQGAEVLATVGGAPVLLRWNVGKGRVAMFAGSVCGEPAPGELPFWEWDGWPMVTAALLSWLAQTEYAAPRQAQADSTANAARLSELRKIAGQGLDGLLEDIAGDSKDQKPNASSIAAKVAKLAAFCSDTDYAHAVVSALAGSGSGFSCAEAISVFSAIERYVQGASFEKPALELVQSGRPGPVALGVRVLGRIRSGKAADILLPLLAKGMGGIASAPVDKGMGLSPSAVPDGEDERLRLAAVQAAGDLADPALLERFCAAAAAWRAGRSKEATLAQSNRELEDNIVAAKARMGDGKAAAALVGLLCNARLELEANVDVTEIRKLGGGRDPDLEEKQRSARLALEFLKPHLARMEDVLAAFPAAGVPALADEAAAWTSPFAGSYLLFCLAAVGDRLGPDQAPALRRLASECPAVSVRALCQGAPGSAGLGRPEHRRLGRDPFERVLGMAVGSVI